MNINAYKNVLYAFIVTLLGILFLTIFGTYRKLFVLLELSAQTVIATKSHKLLILRASDVNQ